MEKPRPVKNLRIEALKRFALAITALNLAGHFFLGFESSWAHPLVAIITTYSLEIAFEKLYAYQHNKKPGYQGGFRKLILFLLPAHITAMAVSMLLFTNENLSPIIFASAVAILSKIILRASINGHSRHFLNPSNTGIATTLLLFPWIGIAPPYQFTENIAEAPDWILPVVFICVGSFLNTKLTKRMPLILAWFGGFLLQGIARSLYFETPVVASIAPLTGVSFLLFSFYMISDPATTPSKLLFQIAFGLSVAFVYSFLVINHIVFGQFFALFIVCGIRGLYFWIRPFLSTERIHSPEVISQLSDEPVKVTV